MFTAITVLIIIVCILLVLVVLVQNPKGGGLASGFTGAGQVMGVKKTSEFIEKLTWGLAIALVVLSIAANFVLPAKEDRDLNSAMQEQIEGATATPQQQAPAQQPAQQNPAAPVQNPPAPAPGK